jgi:hypothetical protein
MAFALLIVSWRSATHGSAGISKTFHVETLPLNCNIRGV